MADRKTYIVRSFARYGKFGTRTEFVETIVRNVASPAVAAAKALRMMEYMHPGALERGTMHVTEDHDV
jgi:hypothetical protein